MWGSWLLQIVAQIQASRQGTSFVATDGVRHTILMDFSAPVGDPVASLRSEVAGLFILQKAEERYNGHLQFMIFTDCMLLLLILSIFGHSAFWPYPVDVVHLVVIFSMKWLTSVLRLVVCLMLIQYAMCRTNVAPYNLAFKPLYGLKWREANFMSPSPETKQILRQIIRINRLCEVSNKTLIDLSCMDMLFSPTTWSCGPYYDSVLSLHVAETLLWLTG